MQGKEFLKDLSTVVNCHSIDSMLNLPDYVIAEYLFDSIKALAKLNNVKDDSTAEVDFIERMYAMYPNKCPKRGTSLGKSRKDKERIRKLLKTYSMDEIESVFKREIEEKYDKHYMQNLSTFLNNFPDPHSEQGCLFVGADVGIGTDKTDEHLFINGVIYR